MNRKILVGYDGGDQSHDALCLAAARVHVIVAAEPVTPYIEIHAEADTSRIRERAEDQLHQALALVGSVSSHLARTSACPVIVTPRGSTSSAAQADEPSEAEPVRG